jgi:hypothetical protein
MTCLENLKQDVSDILDHIRNTVPCCGDIVIYGDSTVYITTIMPGVGEDPTYYGETEVEDWDEWTQYLCHSANEWVTELTKQSNHIELALATGGMSIGLAGFIVAAIVLFVVGGFLSGVVIMAIVSGTIAGYTANMFSDAAEDIEAARDSIMCAILKGGNVGAAIEDALSSSLAWDIFYSHLDYDSAIAILYEGGDGETYLEAELDDSCECDIGGEFQFFEDWEDYTLAPWQGHDCNVISYDGVDDSMCVNLLLVAEGDCYINVGNLCTAVGQSIDVGDKIAIHGVRFSYKHTPIDGKCRLRCKHDGGESVTNFPFSADYSEVEAVFNPPLESTYPKTEVVIIEGYDWGYERCRVDNITIFFDIIRA